MAFVSQRATNTKTVVDMPYIVDIETAMHEVNNINNICAPESFHLVVLSAQLQCGSFVERLFAPMVEC